MLVETQGRKSVPSIGSGVFYSQFGDCLSEIASQAAEGIFANWEIAVPHGPMGEKSAGRSACAT